MRRLSSHRRYPEDAILVLWFSGRGADLNVLSNEELGFDRTSFGGAGVVVHTIHRLYVDVRGRIDHRGGGNVLTLLTSLIGYVRGRAYNWHRSVKGGVTSGMALDY